MSAHRVGLSTALLVAVTASAAGAQRADSVAQTRVDSAASFGCPPSGALVRLWTGTAADSAGRAPAGPSTASAPSGGRQIDTLITLNITDRTWQRDSVSAGVALGVAGSAGARRAPWRACAGATATFGRITASLHNVRGQIHLKADPGALDAIGGTAGRTTPPAPPRR